MDTNSHKQNLGTVLTYAVGTVVVTLAATMIVQFVMGKAEEHAARLASGESDFERKHRHHI